MKEEGREASESEKGVLYFGEDEDGLGGRGCRARVERELGRAELDRSFSFSRNFPIPMFS